MIVRVDLRTVPPTVELLQPEDLGSLEVRIVEDGHAWIAVEELVRLAGARGDDPDWSSALAGMVAYARTRGWVRDADGAVRAHVTHEAA